MKTFRINRNLEAICRSENTRYGFRHLAELYYRGREIATAKCCYYNRTWEKYEFQSVLENLINKASNTLSKGQIRNAKKFVENYNERDTLFNTISMVAKMGEILATTQKEKNDWKARMIKAGLEGRGLTMPDDWDTLSEDEKTKRLDGVIKELDK